MPTTLREINPARSFEPVVTVGHLSVSFPDHAIAIFAIRETTELEHDQDDDGRWLKLVFSTIQQESDMFKNERLRLAMRYARSFLRSGDAWQPPRNIAKVSRI